VTLLSYRLSFTTFLRRVYTPSYPIVFFFEPFGVMGGLGLGYIWLEYRMRAKVSSTGAREGCFWVGCLHYVQHIDWLGTRRGLWHLRRVNIIYMLLIHRVRGQAM
jgi:hypothetical protein